MKMKSDGLKKHHYWVVAGVSVLLVLLAFFMLSGGVSEAIAAKQTAIKTEASNVQKGNAPGQVALTEIDKQKKILDAKKDELWKENWEKQAEFFTWPKLPEFAEYNTLKFGTPLKDYTDAKYQMFIRKEVYKKQYEDMVEKVAPTKFNSGWEGVLNERYIAVWGEKKATDKQLWIAMEDLWVQRALLDPIRIVNESAAKFEPFEADKATPLKRKFRSRIWQIDLEVVNQAPNRILKGKLRNLTSQMQLLGANSTLTLKVWVDANMSLPPVEFKVEGEFVSGDTEIVVGPLPSHIIPPGVEVTELVKVEQVLDERTVPVRQIEKVSLMMIPGQFGSYSKLQQQNALLPPEFWKEDVTATPGSTPTGPIPGAPLTAPPSPFGPTPGFPPFGGAGGGREGMRPGMIRPPGMGTGMPTIPTMGPVTMPVINSTQTLEQAVDAYKGQRYIEVTGQLRRLPVAIKMVVDLRYMQDVMVAYTNSPLRLQIVQYHACRYRGTLMPSTPPDSASPGATPAAAPLQPSPGAMLPGAGASIPGSLGNDIRGGGGPETGPRGGFIPGLTGGTLSSVSDGQANAALIELYIFGIVTLYEKYEAKKDPAAPAVTPAVAPKPETPKPVAPKTEAPKTETPKEPTESAPKPKDPMAPATPPAGEEKKKGSGL